MVDTYGIGARAAAMGGAVSASPSPSFAPYYNPAGLSKAEGTTVSAGVMLTKPDVTIDDYKVGNSAPVNFEDDTAPLVVPHFSVVVPVNDAITFGVAAYVPWGMEVEWDKNTIGANNSYKSKYLRKVVTPALSYKVNSKLSFGAGISLGQSETGASFKHFGMANTPFEADLKDDFNTSWNAGVLFAPTERLSLGLTYRSRTQADFEGDLKIAGNTATTVTLDYDHPEQVQGGIAYRFGAAKNILVEADATWTNWSINKSQHEVFSPALPTPGGILNDKTIPREWEDTIKAGLGIEWELNPTVTIRGGYLWDPTPVPDNSLDFIWPDGDKHIFSIGTGLTFGKFTVDIAASYANIPGHRTIEGESGALNPSYGGQQVSLLADGEIFNFGVTTTYRF